VLQIIEGRYRHLFPDVIDEIYRARYEAFILGRQWSLPISATKGREIDQYDNDQTVYFADFDESGHLQASLRLTPTLHGSLTADYYSHLCQGAVLLRDPFVYEGTRYIVSPRIKTPRNNRIAKARILGAMTEYAWSIGVTHIQTIIDAGFYRSFKEFNSAVFALGPAQEYGGGKSVKGGGSCLAIRLPVTEQAIAELRAYGGLNEPADEGSHPADTIGPDPMKRVA
jgi:N-acyl-L-homoserine lactone synthetase